MIKQTSIDALNKQLDPIKVLQSMGATNIKENRDEIRCFCPIHGSDNQRSLAIYKDNNVGFCYNTGCQVYQEGGANLIQLYAWYRNIKFYEAVEELAQTIGFQLEYDTTKAIHETREKSRLNFRFIEVAHGKGNTFHRNQVIKIEDLEDWQAKHKDKNCYRSYVQYDKNDLSQLYQKDADKSPTVIGNFVMDFDNPCDPTWDDPKKHLQNTVFKDVKDFKQGLKCCLYDAYEVVEKLLSDYDVPEEAVIISFSGCGIHVEVDYRVFGIVPMYESSLVQKYRQIFLVLAEVDTQVGKEILEWNPEKNEPAKTSYRAKYQTADIAMYTKRRLWRLPNSVNAKTGLFKVNIPTDRFLEKPDGVDWILNFAKEPRPLLTFPSRVIPASKAVNLFEHADEILSKQIALKKEAERKAQEEAQRIKLPETAWRGVFKQWREVYSPTTEAADEFLFAGLLTVIGCMLGRRVYMWQATELYPNVFSVIVGDSAKARKTIAIEKAESAVKTIDPQVLFSAGISTTQGLIGLLQLPSEKELKEYEEACEKAEEKGRERPPLSKRLEIFFALQTLKRLEYEGFRLLYYEREFSRLLKKTLKDYSSDFIETLQEAFDMKDELDNHSLTNPMSAQKPCVSLISATTLGKLHRRLQVEDIEGGFANRFMYFYGERKPPKPRPPKPNKEKLGEIYHQLNEVTKKWKHQEFKLSEEAGRIWDEFYCREYGKEYNSLTIDQVSSRLTTHAAKIALIYAATENDDPIINAGQAKAAIAVVEYLERCAFKIFALQTGTKYSKIETLIINFLKEKDGSTITDIWKHIRTELPGTTTRDIQNILTSLAETEVIRKEEETFKDSLGRNQKRTVYKIKFV